MDDISPRTESEKANTSQQFCFFTETAHSITLSYTEKKFFLPLLVQYICNFLAYTIARNLL